MINEILKGRDVVIKKEIISKITRERLKDEEITALKKMTMTESKTEYGMMAFAILGKIGDTNSIRQLIELIKDPSFHVRFMAAKSLVLCGATAVPLLLKTLTEIEDEYVPMMVTVLRSIDKPDITPFLTVYQSATPQVKIAMARVLGSFGANEKAIITLIKTLASPDYNLTRAVIESLVDIGNRILPIVNKLVGNSHPKVIDILFHIMNRIGDPAKALIHDGIRNPNVIIRRAATGALNFAKDVTSIELLIDNLGDKDIKVAEEATKSLLEVCVDEDKIMHSLRLKFRESKSHNQKYWLMKIFHNFPEYYEEELFAYFREEDEVSRLIVNTSSPDKLSPAIFGRFVGLLNDENFYIREYAIDRLVKIGNDQLPVLTASLGDSRQPIVNGVIEVFRQMGARGVNYLIELVGSGNDEQKFNSAFALGMLGDKKAIAPLKGLLEAGNDWIRQYAIKALGQLGDLETILSMVDKGSPENQKVALSAVSGLGADAFEPMVKVLRGTPPDERDKIAQAITSLGSVITDKLEDLAHSEEDENVRFWLMKIKRNLGKNNEFFA